MYLFVGLKAFCCVLCCRTCTRIGSWAWRPWPPRPAAARPASAVRMRFVTATAQRATLWMVWTRRPSCWGCRGRPATLIWCLRTLAPPSPSAPPTTPSASPKTWWSRGTSRRKWMPETGSECISLVSEIRHDDVECFIITSWILIISAYIYSP